MQIITSQKLKLPIFTNCNISKLVTIVNQMASQSSIISSMSSAYNSIYYYPSIKRSTVITNVTNSRKLDTPVLSQDFNKPNELLTYTVSSKNDVTNPVIPEPRGRLTETAAATAKLYAVLEAVADRVEMHTNVGEQRNNWNSLLLSSINMITLTATTMAALTAAQPVPELKLSSAVLFAAATGLLTVMNKLQPSQLVEEQRNARRLFKQLHEEIQTMMALHDCVTEMDVKYMMERVLALDKAYPLPLIGVMLEKFPEKLEPSVWWPLNRSQKREDDDDDEMKYEMKEIVRVLKEKDKHEYIRLGNKALKMNKVLSKLGPLLTAMAATGSVISDSSSFLGVVAMAVAVGGGALSTIVNSIEHGGQVGMVVEMYRNNAGFFRFMEESIESSNEENSELMEMKVSLQLGRSLSQLKELAMVSSSSRKDGNSIDEFASKLF